MSSTILTAADVWQIISTPPMTGAQNMAYDLATLDKMRNRDQAPVLRFFSWDAPGISYGKHQPWKTVQSLIPAGSDAVRRPTGGGIVFHGSDLCLSLCWRVGQPPLSLPLKDLYGWIHRTILSGLPPLPGARLATCNDCLPAEAARKGDYAMAGSPLATRICFTEPVALDILAGTQKIVGGALCRRNNIFLYQGSIQGCKDLLLESRLTDAFLRALLPA